MEKSIDMKKNNIKNFDELRDRLTVEEIYLMSPLQLAYIGDAVYELFIRTFLIKKGLPVDKLHKEAVGYVKAKSQCNIVHALEEKLTEEEKSMVKRGRNTKTNTTPKNADIIDYKYATGFETLIGHLFLNKKDERMFQIFDEIVHMRPIKK